MPVVGRQDGSAVPPKRSRRELRDEGAAAAVERTDEARRQTQSNVLNAVSVFGLGKLMPLGNIGNALLREQQKQTAILEETRDLMKVLVARAAAADDAGHL